MGLGDIKVSENSTINAVQEETVKDVPVADVKKVSPAQDLRDIQYLLLNGIFPGNVAPSVVKSYHLLEQMASQVEKDHAEKAAVADAK